MTARGASGSDLDAAGLARRISAIAEDKKASEIVVLDLRAVVGYTDYFVICSGSSERQARAIHDAIALELKRANGLLPAHVEGDREARWILMDYLDCVVHIFVPETRAFYRLEQLWGEARASSIG